MRLNLMSIPIFVGFNNGEKQYNFINEQNAKYTVVDYWAASDLMVSLFSTEEDKSQILFELTTIYRGIFKEHYAKLVMRYPFLKSILKDVIERTTKVMVVRGFDYMNAPIYEERYYLVDKNEINNRQNVPKLSEKIHDFNHKLIILNRLRNTTNKNLFDLKWQEFQTQFEEFLNQPKERWIYEYFHIPLEIQKREKEIFPN